MEKYRLVPIFVPHLGCPNDCVFCNQRAISGTVKETTEEDVYNILKKAKEETGYVLEVAFYGGSFTAICESLQDRLLDVALKFTDRIRISTRPDYINQQILDRLKSKNVKVIELGAQSMSDKVLQKSKRGHTAKDIIDASNLVKQNGFTLGLQMMVGMPFDDYSTLLDTTYKICKLEPDMVRVYPIVVIEKTELFEMYKNGEYKALDLDTAIDLCSDVLSIFNEKNINVIRVGLNPSDDLSSGKAIAGAYHPAFGQLTSSQIYYKKMLKLLENSKKTEVIFGVNKSEISTAVGQKRINILKLYEKLNIKASVRACDIEKNKIVLLDV